MTKKTASKGNLEGSQMNQLLAAGPVQAAWIEHIRQRGRLRLTWLAASLWRFFVDFKAMKGAHMCAVRFSPFKGTLFLLSLYKFPGFSMDPS